LARAVKPVFERIIREGYEFELIFAHFFYPDGVAAVMLGRSLNKPVVITARGSDLNLTPQHRLPRLMIQWAARHAAGMITVSAALKGVLTDLGVPTERVAVLRNGVDLKLFQPIARAELRAGLGLEGRTLLSVGNLIPLKGHDLAIRALPLLPDMALLIAGHGPEEGNLKALAAQAGVAHRVRFLGTLSQPQLRDYYGAADALVLASSREGWANVLLESMACGTPVIATSVGGTPEVVAAPEAGVLMADRTPDALVRAVRRLFAHYPDHAATRRYAERFSWDEITGGQLSLFERVIGERKPQSGRGGKRGSP
jgi:glycosyltransferase involved in cell wall biosynthesis